MLNLLLVLLNLCAVLVLDFAYLLVISRWLVVADRLHEQECLALVHGGYALQVVAWLVNRHVLPRLFQVLVDCLELFFQAVEALV